MKANIGLRKSLKINYPYYSLKTPKRYCKCNHTLLCQIRPVVKGARPPGKIFHPLEKCVGHSLKILSPSQKTIRHP